MDKNLDFGFKSEEFLGKLTTIPYCQFINASNKNYGIGITSSNAELASFQLTDTWQPVDHEFSDGTAETLLINNQPRLLIINRSQPLMSNELGITAYNKDKFQSGEYKAFSYAVVWFIDQNNKPLSELPFRLKCSGYAGLTFLKNYSYYNNPNSFCKKFLQTYKNLTQDRAVDKNEIFYAHGIYQPRLIRKKATSSINGQSSFAVMTDSFMEPTEANFANLIIKNGSELSQKIKEFIQSTESWLQTESIKPEEESPNFQSEREISESEITENHLTPEPIAF